MIFAFHNIVKNYIPKDLKAYVFDICYNLFQTFLCEFQNILSDSQSLVDIVNDFLPKELVDSLDIGIFKTSDTNNAIRGMYNSDNDSIAISGDLSQSEQKSVLLHEMFHYIYDKLFSNDLKNEIFNHLVSGKIPFLTGSAFTQNLVDAYIKDIRAKNPDLSEAEIQEKIKSMILSEFLAYEFQNYAVNKLKEKEYRDKLKNKLFSFERLYLAITDLFADFMLAIMNYLPKSIATDSLINRLRGLKDINKISDAVAREPMLRDMFNYILEKGLQNKKTTGNEYITEVNDDLSEILEQHKREPNENETGIYDFSLEGPSYILDETEDLESLKSQTDEVGIERLERIQGIEVYSFFDEIPNYTPKEQIAYVFDKYNSLYRSLSNELQTKLSDSKNISIIDQINSLSGKTDGLFINQEIQQLTKSLMDSKFADFYTKFSETQTSPEIIFALAKLVIFQNLVENNIYSNYKYKQLYKRKFDPETDPHIPIKSYEDILEYRDHTYNLYEKLKKRNANITIEELYEILNYTTVASNFVFNQLLHPTLKSKYDKISYIFDLIGDGRYDGYSSKSIAEMYGDIRDPLSDLSDQLNLIVSTVTKYNFLKLKDDTIYLPVTGSQYNKSDIRIMLSNYFTNIMDHKGNAIKTPFDLIKDLTDISYLSNDEIKNKFPYLKGFSNKQLQMLKDFSEYCNFYLLGIEEYENHITARRVDDFVKSLYIFATAPTLVNNVQLKPIAHGAKQAHYDYHNDVNYNLYNIGIYYYINQVGEVFKKNKEVFFEYYDSRTEQEPYDPNNKLYRIFPYADSKDPNYFESQYILKADLNTNQFQNADLIREMQDSVLKELQLNPFIDYSKLEFVVYKHLHKTYLLPRIDELIYFFEDLKLDANAEDFYERHYADLYTNTINMIFRDIGLGLSLSKNLSMKNMNMIVKDLYYAGYDFYSYFEDGDIYFKKRARNTEIDKDHLANIINNNSDAFDLPDSFSQSLGDNDIVNRYGLKSYISRNYKYITTTTADEIIAARLNDKINIPEYEIYTSYSNSIYNLFRGFVSNFRLYNNSESFADMSPLTALFSSIDKTTSVYYMPLKSDSNSLTFISKQSIKYPNRTKYPDTPQAQLTNEELFHTQILPTIINHDLTNYIAFHEKVLSPEEFEAFTMKPLDSISLISTKIGSLDVNGNYYLMESHNGFNGLTINDIITDNNIRNTFVREIANRTLHLFNQNIDVTKKKAESYNLFFENINSRTVDFKEMTYCYATAYHNMLKLCRNPYFFKGDPVMVIKRNSQPLAEGYIPYIDNLYIHSKTNVMIIDDLNFHIPIDNVITDENGNLSISSDPLLQNIVATDGAGFFLFAHQYAIDKSMGGIFSNMTGPHKKSSHHEYYNGQVINIKNSEHVINNYMLKNPNILQIYHAMLLNDVDLIQKHDELMELNYRKQVDPGNWMEKNESDLNDKVLSFLSELRAKGGVERVVFSSGVKTYHKNIMIGLDEFIDNSYQNKILSLNTTNTTYILNPNKDLSDKDKITTSQAKIFIFNNDLRDLGLQQLIDNHNRLLTRYNNLNTKEVYDFLMTKSEENGNIKYILNNKVLLNEIINNISASDINGTKENIINMISTALTNDAAMNFSTVSYEITRGLFNIITKKLINKKVRGAALVLMPDYNAGTEHELKWDHEIGVAESTMPFQVFGKTLLISDLGKAILSYMQANNLKDFDVKLLPEVLKSNPNITPEDIETFNGMLRAFGVRIPTSSKSTAIPIQVRYLTLDTGSTIALPKEIVHYMGCDYDVDTLYVNLKHIKLAVKGKIKTPLTQKQILQNEIQESTIAIWQHPGSRYDRNYATSTDQIDAIAEKYRNQNQQLREQLYNESNAQNNVRLSNNMMGMFTPLDFVKNVDANISSGKKLTGQAAVLMKIYSLLTATNSDNLEQNKLLDLEPSIEKSRFIMALINSCVDNAKKQSNSELNINSKTITVLAYDILYNNLTLEEAIENINKPIIKAYCEALANKKSAYINEFEVYDNVIYGRFIQFINGLPGYVSNPPKLGDFQNVGPEDLNILSNFESKRRIAGNKISGLISLAQMNQGAPYTVKGLFNFINSVANYGGGYLNGMELFHQSQNFEEFYYKLNPIIKESLNNNNDYKNDLYNIYTVMKSASQKIWTFRPEFSDIISKISNNTFTPILKDSDSRFMNLIDNFNSFVIANGIKGTEIFGGQINTQMDAMAFQIFFSDLIGQWKRDHRFIGIPFLQKFKINEEQKNQPKNKQIQYTLNIYNDLKHYKIHSFNDNWSMKQSEIYKMKESFIQFLNIISADVKPELRDSFKRDIERGFFIYMGLNRGFKFGFGSFIELLSKPALQEIVNTIMNNAHERYNELVSDPLQMNYFQMTYVARNLNTISRRYDTTQEGRPIDNSKRTFYRTVTKRHVSGGIETTYHFYTNLFKNPKNEDTNIYSELSFVPIFPLSYTDSNNLSEDNVLFMRFWDHDMIKENILEGKYKFEFKPPLKEQRRTYKEKVAELKDVTSPNNNQMPLNRTELSERI